MLAIESVAKLAAYAALQRTAVGAVANLVLMFERGGRPTNLSRDPHPGTQSIGRDSGYPVIQSLQALRGVQFTVAVGVISEAGDLSRFDNPRQLMAWLGLVPSERSSGSSVRKGGITKAGNSIARKLLIEAAWSYRYIAKVSPIIQKRHEGLPKPVIDRAWDAQLRLCRRFRKLSLQGKNRNVVVTATARELAGFIWDIARRTPVAAA